MLDNFSTKATVAKSRAIYGKRLTAEDYKELLHRNTVTEIAEYLKRNTHYRTILASIDTTTIHRGFLETLLRRNTYNLYERLCRFQNLGSRPFYRYLVMQREISEIVSCILYLNAKASNDYISATPAYLFDQASFDLMALAHAHDYSQILAVLKGTPYYAILKDEVPDANGLYDCSRIESNIRSHYLKWLIQTIDKDFSGNTAKDLHSLIETQIDLINVINGFRMKAHFNTDTETIEEYMLNFYGRLSRRQQHELYDTSDALDYIRCLEKTYYGRQMKEMGEALTPETLENTALTLRIKYIKLKLRQSQSAPVSLYAVVSLFEAEVQNIITIIEGIRYKAPLAYIEKLLII